MTEVNDMKVLAVVDYYLPGYKGGGPAVSVSRIVDCLKRDLEFSVFTRDRDLGDERPYSGIRQNQWIEEEGVKMFYSSPKNLNAIGLRKAIRDIDPDIIYLNSYFSKLTRSVLILRALRLLKKTPLLVAPRGEFSKGALQLKALKKRKYLSLANLFNFHAGITWQVSSVHELEDAKAVVHTNADFFIKAPDIVDRSKSEFANGRAPKMAGSADFAFISRISPKKNLLKAIEMLKDVQGEVSFSIYGPIEDEAYWAKCEAAMASLPKNVQCKVMGGIPSSEVLEKLSQHHFFLFPTLGENFGHVIPEALSAGCPVLVSDQTPWQDFDEQGVGYVIPLADEAGWVRAIQDCVDIDTSGFDRMSDRSKAYVSARAQCNKDIDSNWLMFASTIINQIKWVV